MAVPAVAGINLSIPLEVSNSLITLNPNNPPFDLVIRNRKILTLYADVGALSPMLRAKQIEERFAHAVASDILNEPVIKEFPPYGVMIMINGVPVVSITNLDLDPLGNVTHAQVVADAMTTLSHILSEMRGERSLGTMLRAIGYSVAATALLGLSFWLLLILKNMYKSFLAKKVEATSSTLTRVAHFDSRKFTNIFQRMAKVAIAALLLFLVFTWLAFILKQFPYTRPWGEGLGSFVLDTFRSMGLVIVKAMPNIFKIAIILLIARFVAKMASLLFAAAESGSIKLPGVYPETVRPTQRILLFIIYVFALVACYPYLPGSGSDAFKGISVLIGLMLSLGGSGVINQAMSGLVLMYTRAHQVGDYVRIGETEGVVISLDMLATKIRTSKKEEVTIPNSVVLSTSTKNFTRLAGTDGVILHTSVTIGYDAPWRTVHQLLIDAANRTAGLKKNPPPFVMQTALSDFFVEYQLNAFLEKPETRISTLADLHAHIQDTFNEAEVAIVSPHYVADPPQPMPPK